jgi:hypothetical protein
LPQDQSVKYVTPCLQRSLLHQELTQLLRDGLHTALCGRHLPLLHDHLLL